MCCRNSDWRKGVEALMNVGKRNTITEKFLKALWILFLLILIFRSLIGNIFYTEIDSNTLPIISIQYRGAILSNQSDIEQARQDFPTLYNNVYTYDDLRSSKLIKVTEENWMSFYFPIYPLFCLPMKIFLTLLHLPQDRCFLVTNALLISCALYYAGFKLAASARQRAAAMIMLFVSPMIFYNNYIGYEVLCFSMLSISLVQYYNKKKYSSAFALSLAGMSNSAIMAVGLVMIAEYLITTYRELCNCAFARISVKKSALSTVKYAICFIPCLIPFVFQRIYIGNSIYQVGNDSRHYLGTRMLMYLFDPTLGFGSFAPIGIVAFFFLAGVALLQRRKDALTWLGFLVGVIFAVSLMYHINCGMLFCARYVSWIYPIIPIFLVTYGYQTIKWKTVSTMLFLASISISVFFLNINSYTKNDSYVFNAMTRHLLEYIPQFYNPYSATFYCRTLHVDGAYDYVSPAYYESENKNEIRKMIYKAEDGWEEEIYNELIGDEQSMAYLQEKLKEHEGDGKFHYINFPQNGRYHVRQKTLEEKGEIIPGKIIYENENFSLNKVDNHLETYMPITIKNNTVYKIELEFETDNNLEEDEIVFVDFYKQNYDNPEQEAYDILKDDVYDYTFYFDSQDIGENTLDVGARIIDITSETTKNIEIKRFAVTEMERTDNQPTAE